MQVFFSCVFFACVFSVATCVPMDLRPATEGPLKYGWAGWDSCDEPLGQKAPHSSVGQAGHMG